MWKLLEKISNNAILMSFKTIELCTLLFKSFWKEFLMLTKAAFFEQKYCKISHIVFFQKLF